MATSHQLKGLNISEVCSRFTLKKDSLIDWRQRGPGGAARQAAALRREGVVVRTGAMGELTIDLGTYGWFPSILPSEEAESNDSDAEDDG